jgi:hypothetical protein
MDGGRRRPSQLLVHDCSTEGVEHRVWSRAGGPKARRAGAGDHMSQAGVVIGERIGGADP